MAGLYVTRDFTLNPQRRTDRLSIFPAGFARILRMPRRCRLALSYFTPQLRRVFRWTFTSKENTNFTYELTDSNLEYLAHTLAVATRRTFEEVRRYIEEARQDTDLHAHIGRAIQSSPFRVHADPHVAFGRRLGWYACARLLKPRVIVETGIDKGHGAVILCAALLRNRQEGYPGRYYGTDINPDAGWLLKDPYDGVGRILYGDSLESLRALDEQIDLFINDSDHSGEYEYQEYQVVAPKLSSSAIVLGDNAHVTGKLAQFSRESGRQFLFYREVPKDHWYPGAGIGISFPSA
jgi:predicted O-methyltransferase YrrM